tara:strand:- start:1001 stop:1912 length:912 start_codon:yes stop_codon:yes gene_type:complete
VSDLDWHISLIEEGVASQEAAPSERWHLGASLAGHPCDAYIWASWRKLVDRVIEPKLQRTFEIGKRLEGVPLEQIATICQVFTEDPETGKQFHFQDEEVPELQGSCDAILVGYPDQDDALICEVKTANEKNFKALVNRYKKTGKAVQHVKPRHFAQMQLYCHWTGLDALYVVMNKNTSELYLELVPYDPTFARALVDRIKNIVESILIPEPKYDEDFWLCRFCEFSAVCHEGDTQHRITCRSCLHVRREKEGEFSCNRQSQRTTSSSRLVILSNAAQTRACDSWSAVPTEAGLQNLITRSGSR